MNGFRRAIALILLVPMLAGTGGSALGILAALGKAGLIIAVALLGARRVMPIVLERVAKTCSQELFLLSLIAICFGMALLASLAGVSLELGAFLAGLIVSESRFSEHAFGEIMPLQILFAATFFVSVGMLLDIGFLMSNLPLVLGVVVLVLLIKVVITGISMKALGFGTASSVAVAFILAQVGEFSFVLERAGRELSLFPAGMADTGSQTFIAATVVLMVLTPPMSQVGMRLARRLEARRPAEPEEEMPSPAEAVEAAPLPDQHTAIENHIIVAGYGRGARRLSRVLHSAHIPHVIITLSPPRAQEAEADGRLVVRGDAARQNALLHARIMQAKMLFIPDDDAEFAHRVARVARTLNPTLRIVARTRYQDAAEALIHAGTDQIVTEELETIAQLFAEVLRDYQIEPAEVEHCLSVVRGEHYHVLRDTAEGVLAPIGDMIVGALDTRTVTLREGASIIDQTLEAIGFEKKGLSVKSIRRGHSVITMPPPHLTLNEGDMLTLRGTADAFAQCAELFRATLAEVPEPAAAPRPAARQVHLYGTDWCPLTGGFRAYLKRHDIPFDYHNIEQDAQAEEAVKAMNNGKLKFPMVVVGDQTMKNPPIDELETALRAAGLTMVEG